MLQLVCLGSPGQCFRLASAFTPLTEALNIQFLCSGTGTGWIPCRVVIHLQAPIIQVVEQPIPFACSSAKLCQQMLDGGVCGRA